MSRTLITAVLVAGLFSPMQPAQAFDLRCQAIIPALEVTVKGLRLSADTTQSAIPTLKRKAAEARTSAKKASDEADRLEKLSSASPSDTQLADRARAARAKATAQGGVSKAAYSTLSQTEKRLPGLKAKLADASAKLAAEKKRCAN